MNPNLQTEHLHDGSTSSDQNASESDEQNGTLFLVVHGIGDPVPGQTVRTFAACFAAQYDIQKLKAVEESLWIPMPEGNSNNPPDLLEPVATHIQRGTIAGERVVFSEVFWADLSLVRSSLWSVLIGFFEILFGLPHVVRESLRIPENKEIADRLPRRRMGILGWICNLVATILLGPVAALNGLLILLLVSMVLFHASATFTQRKVSIAENAQGAHITEQVMPSSTEPGKAVADWVERIGQGAVPVMLLLLFLLIAARQLSRKGRWQQFWKWVMWCSGLLLALDGIVWGISMWKPEWGGICSTEAKRNVLGIALCLEAPRGFLWHGAVVVLALVLALAANSLLMLMALTVWASTYCRKQQNYFPWFRYPLDAGFTATGMMMGLWSLFIPLLWQFGLLQLLNVLPDQSKDLGQDIHDLYSNALPLMVSYMVFTAILGLSILAVWLWRWKWSLKFGTGKLKPGDYGVKTNHPPRLIVHWGIVWISAFLSFLGSIFFLLAFVIVFLFGVLNLNGINVPALQFVVAEQGSGQLAENLTLGIITAMGIFGSFLLPYLVNGVDILLDVINHFRQGDPRSAEPKDAEHDRYWIRKAIYDRFYQVLREMLKREHPKRLCIIAHSQGTVIAIDNLNDKRIVRLIDEAEIERVDLVTMGSPFEHLYQYYFPASYPTLEEKFQRWERLQKQVDRWFNVFRVDDFVGTHILDPDDPKRMKGNEGNLRSLTKDYWTSSGTEHIRNLPVRPRGHNDYWNDLPVLETLKTLDLIPEPAP